MAAGGYIYEQVDLAYDASGNGATVRSWALAVHLAWCKAFMAAAAREETSFGGAGWESVQTSLYDEMTESYLGDDIYIQDIHPTSVDSAGNYPAFVTFFRCKNTDHSEYCILTYSGFNSYADYSNPSTYYSYGLYLPKTSVLGNYYVGCGQSMAHAFARTGFGVYDVCDPDCITTDCTAIMAAHCKQDGYDSNYNTSYYSLVYTRYTDQYSSNLVGKTFQFGFAIKGTQIIAFERRSDATHWNWSIIGDIIKSTITAGDTHTIGGVLNDYSNEESIESCSSLSSNGTMTYGISFSKSDGSLYIPSDSSIYVDMNRYGMPYGICSTSLRTSTQSPTDTRYNAVFVGATYTSWSSSCIDGGVDGDGNGCKGFLDTDIIRQVSAGVCQNVGATFQSGNFVAMKQATSSTVGFLLGWDASNASIM